jgi:hypothetical protein
MNRKEIAEIRRRFNPEKSNITSVRGCYVNEKREIISTFSQSLVLMPQEEAEKYLAIFKKTLSGAPSRNLIDIGFSTSQVTDSEQHKLLMSLRNSSLRDEDAVQTFFRTAIDALDIEGNYLILLMHDTYDVPSRAKDGREPEDSQRMFSYIICSICPVRMTKSALSYYASDNGFHSRETDWVVTAPELGFMFPAFDDRSANIYNAVCYTRDIAGKHDEFIDAVFHTVVPMPAAAQKEIFQSILADTLAEECSYENVQAVHERLSEIIEEHKTNKDDEPLVISKNEVKTILESCGVSESRISAFDEKYNERLGAGCGLNPQNIIDAKQFELRTPDVVVRVNPERGDIVGTRIIDGIKYILIRADEGIEVNGINISIAGGGRDCTTSAADKTENDSG